jgi:transposase-like protein
MGKHYSKDLKEKIVSEYKSREYGSYYNLAKKYSISDNTIYKWIVKDRKQENQINDLFHKRGRPNESNIDYKERYEILKKYQAFLKAQRERK